MARLEHVGDVHPALEGEGLKDVVHRVAEVVEARDAVVGVERREAADLGARALVEASKARGADLRRVGPGVPPHVAAADRRVLHRLLRAEVRIAAVLQAAHEELHPDDAQEEEGADEEQQRVGHHGDGVQHRRDDEPHAADARDGAQGPEDPDGPDGGYVLELGEEGEPAHDHNGKVDPVPAVPEVGARVQHKAHGHHLAHELHSEERLEDELHHRLPRVDRAPRLLRRKVDAVEADE
mmetsp:Transcript_27814/g.81749  ORF Transcript_27814/g.81749 Transcript_27814/m.81749 type:complete len:238 (+) Transcript_27814:1209-1922(+)